MNDLELNPLFIEREGKREYAVLPYEEFERLQSFIEDAQDLFALRQAKAEDDGEYLSLADVEKRLQGKS
jgi:hypothetical protein